MEQFKQILKKIFFLPPLPTVLFAFRAVMTGATGGGVCTVVIGMAVFMIWKSTRQIKKLHLIEH